MQELLNVKAAGTYSDHSALKVKKKAAAINQTTDRDRLFGHHCTISLGIRLILFSVYILISQMTFSVHVFGLQFGTHAPSISFFII
jgi:hypothetical protein